MATEGEIHKDEPQWSNGDEANRCKSAGIADDCCLVRREN